MLPSETMIWQPEFTDKILSRKPGAVQSVELHDKVIGHYLNIKHYQ
ncbi:IS1 family transposase [Escherichia coli]